MIHFTMAQIRAFHSIVRHGSFSAAAEELCITQPSISQRVRELETALGSKLFIRRGPHITLTVEGHALVGHAERLLKTAGEIVELFQTKDPLQGLLRLGVTDGFALIALSDLLQRLGRRYPGLKASLRVHDGGTMSQLLNERELDIAILPTPEVQPHVHCELVGQNKLAWYGRADGVPAAEAVTPQELVQHHLVVNAAPSRLHRTAQKWFRDNGVEADRLSNCNSLAITLRAVLSGHAIGLLPTRLVRDELALGLVRRVNVVPEMAGLDVYICYQHSTFGERIQEIAAQCRQVVLDRELFTDA